MALSRYSAIPDPLDIELLQRVFDQFAKARGLTRRGPEVEDLAAEIVRLHQEGLSKEEELVRALTVGERPHH